MYIGLLPIGSVVRLKEAESSLMIIGYFPVGQGRPDYVWDYAGVVFPGGCLDTTQTLQFDKEQIEEIQYIGYEDEEQHHFIMQLNCQEHAIKSQFQNAGKKDEEWCLKEYCPLARLYC